MSSVDIEQSLWWDKIKCDLDKAVQAAQKSFKAPGVIIGFTGDEEKTGYLIRLNNGEVGVYSKHILGKRDLPTGVKIKSNLPNPKNTVIEPQAETFTFEVLREQIKLLPRLWLKGNIKLLLAGEDIKPVQNFDKWVLLTPEKKQDKQLLGLLKTVVEYEGLRGLARFNDYASK